MQLKNAGPKDQRFLIDSQECPTLFWSTSSSPDPGAFSKIGDWGEAYAEFRLQQSGLRIVERNKRYSCGELDLVATRGVWFWPREMIFCEVKTRTTRRLRAAEAVDANKQRKLQLAAQRYLVECSSQRRSLPPSFRFDVIEVYLVAGVIEFCWTENAFEVDPEIFLF